VIYQQQTVVQTVDARLIPAAITTTFYLSYYFYSAVADAVTTAVVMAV